MVRYIVSKIKPTRGFAHIFHFLIIALIPPFVWLFIRLDLVVVAALVIILSKWRIFAVHPRFWITHFRTNAVDLITGYSFLIFIAQSTGWVVQLLWVILYEIWLLVIKTGSTPMYVSAQAFIAQIIGLVAAFLALKGAFLGVYVLVIWVITYACSKHFFGVFDELHGNLMATIWAFFSACLVWVLGHWLVFFGQIAQPALLISIIGFSLGGLYYLQRHNRLNTGLRRQLIFLMMAMILILVVFTDWGDKAL